MLVLVACLITVLILLSVHRQRCLVFFATLVLLTMLYGITPTRATAPSVQSTSVSAPAEVLYFFNSPETVRHEGVLGQALIPANASRERAFFHFVNKTGSTCVFQLSLPRGSRVLRLGWSVSRDPLLAGTQAASRFLSSVPKNDISKIQETLRESVTVSGIVEFLPPASGGYLTASLGAGSLVHGAKVDRVALAEVVAGSLTRGGATLRLCDKPVQGRVSGEYGSSLIVRSNSAGKLQVNPRGGSLRFVAQLKRTGAVIVTQSLSTYHWHTVAQVAAGDEWEIIPVGGAFYPMELRLAP